MQGLTHKFPECISVVNWKFGSHWKHICDSLLTKLIAVCFILMCGGLNPFHSCIIEIDNKFLYNKDLIFNSVSSLKARYSLWKPINMWKSQFTGRSQTFSLDHWIIHKENSPVHSSFLVGDCSLSFMSFFWIGSWQVFLPQPEEYDGNKQEEAERMSE